MGPRDRSNRKLYISIITSIADYQGQKSYEAKIQKIQNHALRKILGVFKTSPIGPMEIEANIPPPGIRLNKKIRNYALKVTQMEKNHPIRIRTPITYPPKFQIGLDVDILKDKSEKLVDWNQKETKSLNTLPN